MNTHHLVPARAVSLYRREAKRRSRSSDLSFCQGLDIVARENRFANWRAVIEAQTASAVAELEFVDGFVIAMDIKEGMDFDSSSGFVADPLIDMVAIARIVADNLAEKRASPSPVDYYDDDNARDQWEEHDFDPDEEREWVQESHLFFRYAGDMPIDSMHAACKHLCAIWFWRSIWMWFRGELYDGQWINDQIYPCEE